MEEKIEIISNITNEDKEIVEHNYKYGVYNHISYEEHQKLLEDELNKQIQRWKVNDKESK